jgi:hypothetical protein
MFKRLRMLQAFAMASALALSVSASAQTGPAEVDRRMAEIEAALDKCEAQMEQIGAAGGVAERQRLLREHAYAMRENVRALRLVDEPFSPAMRIMMAGGNQNPSAEAMMKAHALIARRIALMDRMMAQMMEQLMRHQELTGKP